MFTWLYRGVTSFDEMSNLPKALREKLKEQCILTVPTVARKQVSKLDGTIKYLWELADGNCIETVLMQYHHGIPYVFPVRLAVGWAVLFARLQLLAR